MPGHQGQTGARERGRERESLAFLTRSYGGLVRAAEQQSFRKRGETKMTSKVYYQDATEAGQDRIKNIRRTMQMIENELQALESQRGFDYEDSAMLKNLDVGLEEVFEKLVEATFA